MLLHVDHQSVDVAKIAHVAQLVHLIVADRLDLQLGNDVLKVVGGRRQRRDAASGESDLGCGGELVNQVRITRSLALHEDLDQVILLVLIQVMHAIGIVPEDPEIGSRGLEPCESPDCLIRVRIACGITVFGHAPDSLDGLVLVDQFLYHVHVRAFRCQRDRDHLYAEIFRDREMSVISGNRAEKFHPVLFAPGSIAHNAVSHCSCNCIVHDVQRGVSEDDDVVGIVLHHVAQKDLRLLYARNNAVIAAVRSVLTGQVTVR